MKTSESINELAKALSAAQGDMGGAAKDTKNPFFNHNYADLASVKEAIRVPFAKNGLSVVQFPQTTYSGDPQAYEWTAKRSGEVRYGVRVFCVVSVVTRLLHSSGQWMEDSVSAMLPNGDPQSVGSAITYLRRYALQAAAGVAPEDDDGEATTQSGQPKAVVVQMAPVGFDDWLTDMAAVAEEGTAKLQAAWKASPVGHRQYLTTTHPKNWESLKAIAAKVIETVPA